MAENIFDGWKKILNDFQNSVSKDLEEIHQQKNEVQRLKTDIFDRLDSGRYITDDQRIVISAPEIIIGNVDKSGDLKGSGKVIIRGNAINVEGIGQMGSINQRASIIKQTAVDPGIDGMENVVYSHSAIINQARAITLESQDAKDAFSVVPTTLGESGVRIHADKTLQVEAAMSANSHKKSLEELLSALDKQKGELKTLSESQKKSIEQTMSNLEKLMSQDEQLNGSVTQIRVNMVEMEQVRMQVDDLLPALYRSTTDFIHTVSLLAEVNRKEKALKAEKDAIKTGDKFTKDSTGASLSLKSEHISVACRDNDNNLRTNPGAGISINTPQMGVNMRQDDGTLVEHSAFGLITENIHLSTGNPKKDGSEISAVGEVTILSKNIKLESMDFQKKDKAFTEKGLAADGKISIAAKNIEVSAATPSKVERDEKGKIKNGSYKAEGDIVMKSKNVTIETVDYDVENGNAKSKAMVEGSKLLLLAENMTLGMETDKIKSKKMEAISEEIAISADKTFEAQQGEKKASMKMADGKMNLASSGNGVKGKTEFKDAVQGTELTMNKVEAKQSFKSMNIKDGM